MAENMTFLPAFANQICAFTYDNISFSKQANTWVTLSYDLSTSAPTISIGAIGISASTNPGTSLSLTAELVVGNNSTGEIPFTRTTNTVFRIDRSSSPNAVAVPFSDSDAQGQIIIRANGTTVTSNTFLFPSPFQLSVTSISPTPETGKVCTVTLNRSIPNPADFPWRLNGDLILVSTYHDDTVYRLGTYAYATDMATRINGGAYGFSQFTFYIPYDASKARTDNQAKFKVSFDASLGSRYGSYFSSQIIRYTFEHVFTISYVDQTDPLAAPTVILNAIAENPSGMLAKYGKYVGGGIGKITFSIASIVYKFGATFSSRTMSLYNSNGTLNKQWTYSNTNSFTLSLTNKTDGTWYMVVSITDSEGRTGSASTATFQAYGYEGPSIILLAASRCDQDGTPNDSGAYCKISYQFKVFALGDVNSKTVTLIAPDDTHIYTTLDYDHGSAYQYISTADTETSYQIILTVEDDFGEISQSMVLSTAGVIMDFLYDGKGIGLGKIAETTKMVEVNPQWTFKAQTIMIRGQDLATILQQLGYTFPT